MKKSNKIIGVDLGSYNSAVSVYEGNEVRIIPNSEGSSTTPSYVAFTKEGETKVGDPAKRQATVNPEGTIFNIKRLMGKTYDQVKHLKRPYKIVDNNGRAAVKVKDKVYSPEEISAMIIQKMKKTAEDFLGEIVERAIITVPAHFNSDEREATKVAGEIAGLKVERIISEPTAASLCIGSNNNKKYAVYDFGGQTMDLSVIDIGDGVYEILATDGDLDLGGSVIDEEIVKHLADTFAKENAGFDLRKDPMAHQRLFEAAEKAKIELSTSANTDINLPYITAIDGMPKHLVLTLTKAKFEQLAESVVKKTIDISKRSVEKSGLKFSDIDDVILVGGSSRIPLVQKELEKLFGKVPNKSLNPDTCVSQGATIQGGVLTGQVQDVLLLDVLPLSLGIETMGGVMTKMIEANTTIPCQKQETFSTAADNQPAVDIKVFQGERPLCRDNKMIGNFVFDGIMPAPRGIPKIQISFDVDANGILKVTAKDEASGKTKDVRIEGSSALSKEEIEKMKNDAAANADADKKEKETIDKLNSADSLIFQTEKQIKEFADKLSEDDKKSLEETVNKLKEAHAKKDVADIDTLTTELNEKWTKISTDLYSKASSEAPASDNVEEVKAEDVEDVE